MLTAAHCLTNAIECANLAREAQTGKQRAILFEMSRTWETMAKHADRFDKQRVSDIAFVKETEFSSKYLPPHVD